MNNIVFVPGKFLSTLSLRRATVRALKFAYSVLFLSTLSLRRATTRLLCRRLHSNISIHALLAESDRVLEVTRNAHTDFYPRSPCGERPAIDVFLAVWAVISIHALLAESDGVTVLGIQHRVGISIHALLAESDYQYLSQIFWRGYFYPRSPCGERLWLGLLARPFFIISIHALLAESDGQWMNHNTKF